MYNFCCSLALAGFSLLLSASFGQGGSFGAESPFSAPNAKVQYAPTRTYDLQHLALYFDVDYPNRLLKARSVNSIEALMDGSPVFRFHAGASTKIESVEIDGREATYKRDSEGILVDTAPTKKGQKYVVTVHYHLKKAETPKGQGVGGWHWHEPDKGDPSKVGFWTNGETSDTRDWAVTWDYPNDFTTSETHTTVPADWQVIGNGLPAGDTPVEGGKRHTVVWRLDQPHATYLTSVVGGPFDIHYDRWRGIQLYYVCPKGMGDKLDYTFEHTKNILDFYSDKLGVKYPWPKYAQDMTYDFGGGQENVSATTYGLFMTTPRDGYHASDWIIAHETGHQWFGDYVTCKDWGQIWLNESFATFMEMSYTLFSRGPNASMREVEDNSQQYLSESKRYKRPLATNFYSDPGVMFDEHTYPKGGVLLISLRRQIGEKGFYAGLNRYLTRRHNGPVESNDLCEDLTEASGINLHPWFDQWVYKPGHPIIDWSWTWDSAKSDVVVHVKQTQDQSIGTPIYDVPTHIGIISSSAQHYVSAPIHLNAADQEFRVSASSRPLTVVFDPDHDFLREIPKQPWTADEMPAVLRYAPNPVDRAFALNRILDAKPSDAQIQDIAEVLKADTGEEPGIVATDRLVTLDHPNLLSFWLSEATHANYTRRATAVNALSRYPKNPVVAAALKSLINDKQPYSVVGAAVTALYQVDFASEKDLVLRLAKGPTQWQVRSEALLALTRAGVPEAADLIFSAFDVSQPTNARIFSLLALKELKTPDPRTIPTLRAALKESNFGVVIAAANCAADMKLKELIPDIEETKKREPRLAPIVDSALAKLKG